MRYDDEIKAILADSRQLDADTRRLHWNLARTAPDPIRRTAQARVDAMKESNEPFRRLPRTEHARVLKEIETEERTTRLQAAGVARVRVEPRAQKLNQRLQTLLGKMRRDVQLTFGPLDGFGPGDMVVLELLRETIRPAVERADVADLLRRARRALEVRDARAQIEFELIEDRIAAGRLAKSEADLPLVRELTEVVNIAQDVRVPEALEPVSAVIANAEKAISRAALAYVNPIDPAHPANLTARTAFEGEHDEYTAALEAEKQAAAGAGQ